MNKQPAVALIAAVAAALALAATPAAQARGSFAASRPARGAVGGHFGPAGHFGQPGHFGHFAPSRPQFAARAFGPQRFAPGRFRGPIRAAPRFNGPRFAGPRFAPGARFHRPFVGRPAPPAPNFAPGGRRFGNDHFRHFGGDDHFHRFNGDDDFHRFGDNAGEFHPFYPFDAVPGWHRRFWGGGYWGGQFWPRVYYGASFDWFLTALPPYCPVYWYDNVPYYYYDDVYYVWSPQYDGYVVADPPPVEDTGAVAQQNSAENSSATGALDAAAAAGNGTATYDNSTSAEVYAYPEHGQSEQQQQQDRRECAQWAATQTSSQARVTVADYRQAMIACFEARGYSAR